MDELLKFAPRPRAPGRCSSCCVTGSPAPGPTWPTLTGQARSTIAARVDLLLVVRARRTRRRGQLDRRPPAGHVRVQPRTRASCSPSTSAPRTPRLAVTDLVGTVLAEHRRAHRDRRRPRPPCSTASVELGQRAARHAPAAPSTTWSASGVGLPGPVEHSTGRPINPPIMPGWDDADVPGILSAHARASPCSSTTTST